MSITEKALWIIERNSQAEIDLGGIADGCHVSRFHLAHAFTRRTGTSIVHYLRARRLSEAARMLVDSTADILDIALRSGYGSHEAFTRAFKAQFGRVPNAIRREGSIAGLPLVERVILPPLNAPQLAPPRIVDARPLTAIGVRSRLAAPESGEIARMWQEFMADVARIRGVTAKIPVGVCIATDDNHGIDYVCAVEASGTAPAGMVRLDIPARTYAVFTHDAHISSLAASYAAIWDEYLEHASFTVIDAPILERHKPTFDPTTGNGGVEIWVPLEIDPGKSNDVEARER